MSCPTDADLIAFSGGMLSEEKLQHLFEHLSTCSRCESALQTLCQDSDSFASHFRNVHTGWHEGEDADKKFHQLIARVRAIGHGPEFLSGSIAEIDARVTASVFPVRIGVYELLEKLGQGGMGVVFKAWHFHLKRNVAIKILPHNRVGNHEFVQRFAWEMEAIGAVDDPHVVRALDAGEADGHQFLAMELVDGIDLGQILQSHGPLPVADAAEIVRQTALGLAAIERHGLVHRDIKPSNLMLTRGGSIKLLDLGLARSIDPDDDQQHHSSHRILGTIDYISPEQITRETPTDIRSDIYSLGCTLYHMLAGEPPFPKSRYRSTAAKLVAHCSEVHQPLQRSLPQGLREILERMIAKRPSDRFSSPAALLEAITEHAEGSRLDQLLSQGSSADVAVGPESELDTAERPAIEATSTIASSPARSPQETWRSFLASWQLVVPVVAIPVVLLALSWLTGFWSQAAPTGQPAVIDAKQAADIVELLKPSLDSSQWQVFGNGKSLQIVSDDICLLQLGNSVDDQLRLAVDVRQLGWPGRVGIFLGYKVNPMNGGTVTSYEVLQLSSADAGKYTLSLIRHTDSRGLPFFPKIEYIKEWPIPEIRMPVAPLKFGVRKGRIAYLHFAGIDLVPETAEVPPNAVKVEAVGQFGVFVNSAEGVFSAFEINGVKTSFRAR